MNIKNDDYGYSLCKKKNEKETKQEWKKLNNMFLLFLLRFTTVLSHWDFFHGKFGLLSPEKASRDRVALPNLRCKLGVLALS